MRIHSGTRKDIFVLQERVIRLLLLFLGERESRTKMIFFFFPEDGKKSGCPKKKKSAQNESRVFPPYNSEQSSALY